MSVPASIVPSSMEGLKVPIDSVLQHPRNPNEGDVAAIIESLQELGMYKPIVVQDSTHYIIAGNHTWAAMKELHQQEIAAVFVDVEDDEAERIMLADNEIARRAKPNSARLASIVAGLHEKNKLRGTGYSHERIGQLLEGLRGTVRKESPDAPAPAPPTDPVTQTGDVWILGPHRLLCGDSTKGEDVAKLTESVPIDMVFMDPPYAIYGSSTGVGSDVADDKMVRPFFRDALNAVATSLKLFGHAYICCDWRSWASWWEMARDSGMVPKNMIVWDKGGSGLGGMYANTFELLLFASRKPKQFKMAVKVTGERMISDSNLWRENRVPSSEREHNAQKPVGIIARAVKNSTEEGERVLDLFAGSGSTLLAAHDLGRIAYLMEFEPKWCDVICQRFEAYTGIRPKRGKKEHSFV